MDFADPPTMASSDFDSFKEKRRDSTMSQDLGLDPSDPLNLLLNNSQDSSMEDSSSSLGSPPDWSQLSSTLWPNQGENMKPFADLSLDFLHMGMDFNPSMAVDPSSLHYDNSTFDLNQQLSNEFMSSSFPFTFNTHPSPEESAVSSSESSSDYVKERRSSVTSLSETSSPGASLSPVLEHTPAVDELAQRVRQTAGVMLAVPAGSQYQQQPAKLPIPRLSTQPKLTTKPKRAPTQSGATSITSSTTSSPGPEDAATVAETPVPASTTSVIPRPKTSHTTIERRYRTNLNARIQSLRQAVPALRVLEEKNKKGKDGESEGGEKDKSRVDIVDERGFADGVKVARKGSKANVLGKAVEYIRVLKKREARLKREQNGLKSLIGGLVGGPALLKEWEHEWKEKFGGEENDEIEGEEAEPMSDDEDGDEEGDGDEDEGRAKKKAKIVKAPKKETVKKLSAPTTGDPTLSTCVPEKRKRGRPRKVQPPAPATTLAEDTSSVIPSGELVVQQPMVQDSQGQPAQPYLLATFALFSFFNSPLTSSTSQSHSHSHSGSVLGHVAVHSQASVLPNSYGWRELIQAFHLIVSALVFFSIVVPWLPKMIKRTRFASFILPSFPQFKSTPIPLQTSVAPLPPSSEGYRITLLSALAPTRRGASDEADQLHSALGVPPGVLGLVMSCWRSAEQSDKTGLEQRAWVRLGELVAFDCTTSIATRLQTYWCMHSCISFFKTSTSDLSTLALILRPLSSAKAVALWNRAGKTEFARPFERLVLSSLTLDEATERLATVQHNALSATPTPIGLLATMLVRQRLLKHTSVLFVRTVLPNHSQNGTEHNWMYAEQDKLEEEQRKETIDAGKSLGGKTKKFAEILEKVWTTSIDDIENIFDDDDTGADTVEVEIRCLLSALILYRRIFPSSILSCAGTAGVEAVSFILSPPPSPSSPSRTNMDLHLALRRALASDVFDFDGEDAEDDKLNEEQKLGVALEDARDRVVDMLVESERTGRNRALKGC